MQHIEYKHLVLFLFAIGLFPGCGGGNPGENTGSVASSSGPAFRFSSARPPEGKSPETNWCFAPFEQNVLVNAEKINTNRRYFYLLPGVTWLTAERDNARANLYLRPMPNGDVEVFTGANFPYCLSRPDYLRPIGENRSALRYDNGTNINFNLEVQTDQGHPKITVEFRPGTFYGLIVLHNP